MIDDKDKPSLWTSSDAVPRGFTLMNILLVEPGLLGVQYTDMDLRSRENSRVNSFFISCLMIWGEKERQGEGGRNS